MSSTLIVHQPFSRDLLRSVCSELRSVLKEREGEITIPVTPAFLRALLHHFEATIPHIEE